MAPNMDLVPSESLSATQRGYYEVAMRAKPARGGYMEIGPDIGFIVHEAAQTDRFDNYWLFEPNLAVHEQLAAATHGRAHSIVADMTDLSSVPDGSVGLAVMIHVLDHLLDPVSMLAQIRRKLMPGGRLVIVTHNEKSLLRKIMRNNWPPFCLQHPVIYNPESIKATLGAAGFAQVTVERSTNVFPLSFMVRQAAWTVGVKLDKLPVPDISLGLKLGNIITVAGV